MAIDLREYFGPVQTCDRKEAEILSTDMRGEFPIAVRFRDKEYNWKLAAVRTDGTYKKETPFIIPVLPFREQFPNSVGYSNLRKKGNGLVLGTLYSTREEAEERTTENTLMTCEVYLTDVERLPGN